MRLWVSVCLCVYALHMAVCGRKGYWWIISLTFEDDPITALHLSLPLPSSTALIPLFFSILSSVPTSPTCTQTHRRTCPNSSYTDTHVHCFVEVSGGSAHILDLTCLPTRGSSRCAAGGCKPERASGFIYISILYVEVGNITSLCSNTTFRCLLIYSRSYFWTNFLFKHSVRSELTHKSKQTIRMVYLYVVILKTCHCWHQNGVRKRKTVLCLHFPRQRFPLSGVSHLKWGCVRFLS